MALSTRAKKVLCRLGVKTIGEFRSFDLRELAWARGCGNKTLAELAKAQNELQKEFPVPTSVCSRRPRRRGSTATTRETVQQPATAGSWEVLPLFSWKSAEGITAADLHSSYQPSMPLECFHFSMAASRTVEAQNITSLGELLLTPTEELLDRYRGSAALSAI